MSKSLISIKNLGKRYLLGLGGGEQYRALRDVIVNTFKSLVTRSAKREPTKAIWALRDVSLEIKEGMTLGIIGRNGAGKTTLLKLLSRITEPTTGEIHLRGRIASLLEVGTGFHPELTGRENVFMNGSILGMRRSEINSKFDEIVAFAEVEKFLDTPVKRYSSGMQVRLAFAVAAHLDPEILLVDEVLAVGDSKFQKKCVKKMEKVSTSGRTVLFVSHNMGTVRKLCKECVWLDKGTIKMIGETEEVVEAYLSEGESFDAQKVWDKACAPVGNGIRLDAVRVVDVSGRPSSNFKTSDQIFLETEFEVLAENGFIATGYHVFRRGNLLLSSSDINLLEEKGFRYKKGKYKTRCSIPANLLNHGDHCIEAAVAVNYVNVIQTGEIIFFRVFNDNPTEWGGEIRPLFEWSITNI